tara:strand:+ start:242 stop:361 length:120 start_codon:yes stop_codon:yes gene_type:complete
MSQQQEQEEREKRGEHKGRKESDNTFFDYLAGQMEDEEL